MSASRVIYGLLGLIGVSITLVTVWDIWRNSDGYLTLSVFEEFLLPILLTLSFLPLIYLLAVYFLYQAIFLRLDYCVAESSLSRYLKWVLIKKLRFRLFKLRQWSKEMTKYRFASKEEIDLVVSEFSEKAG